MQHALQRTGWNLYEHDEQHSWRIAFPSMVIAHDEQSISLMGFRSWSSILYDHAGVDPQRGQSDNQERLSVFIALPSSPLLLRQLVSQAGYIE